MEIEQEKAILSHLREDNINWDCTTRRKLIHFGFQFDMKGGNIQPATPIPEYLAEAHYLAAQLLLRNGLEHQLNQCTVAIYEPGLGVVEHSENPLLGNTVVTVGFQGVVLISGHLMVLILRQSPSTIEGVTSLPSPEIA